MKHLEPVTKHKSVTFSILLLRNDSRVVRFRLSSRWIKFLFVFFFCFSGASGAAGYAAHYYWKKYNILRLERSEMAEALGENKRQLSEFESIARIRERQPRSSMAGVGTLDQESDVGSVLPLSTDPPGQAPPARTGLPAPPPGTEPSVETQAGPAQNDAAASAPQASQPLAGTAPQAASATPSQTVSPASSQIAPENEKDHPALIDKVLVRPAGPQTYRVTYELSNRERDRDPGREQYLSLSGKVVVSVVTKGGTRRDVILVSGDSLRFVIKWGKRVDFTFSLPPDLPPGDAAKLLLALEGDNFPSITYTFPMP